MIGFKQRRVESGGEPPELLLLAAKLQPGEVHHGVCPFCRGGVHSDRGSFRITKFDSGMVRYVCFRNKCRRRGSIGELPSRVTGADERHAKRRFNPRPYRNEVVALPNFALEMFSVRYDLTAEELNSAGFAWASNDERVVMPVWSPTGIRRGSVLRSYSGAKPKALTYKEVDEPWQSWYNLQSRGGRPEGGYPADVGVVVVEDIVSAIKVSRQFPAVAILGTHLSLGAATEIVRAANNAHIVLALDRDAVVTALGYAKRYRSMGNFRVAMLSNKDLKEENDERIRSILVHG